MNAREPSAGPTTDPARPVVVVSNRGPLSFSRDDRGELRARRGSGGLVSGLGPLLVDTSATWLAAALSDGDREAARGGLVSAEGFNARLLAFDPAVYRRSYDVICNATLWFAHHLLFDLPRRPRVDRHWHEAWEAYRQVNAGFATAVAEDAPEGAAVLVQDYHLCLLGPALAKRRPDLRTVHFSHTPFAPPELLRVLPAHARTELLEGLAGHHAVGFHAQRWEAAFRRCCAEFDVAAPATFVAPLGPDPGDLAKVAASPAGMAANEELTTTLAGRRLILRVDRIELSKNLLRGFWAYDDLLTRYPTWRGKVTFGAFVYPSREGLPEYLSYRQEVESLVDRLNEKWATPDWTPILFDPSDDFPRSVAALRHFDVLLVNPVRDGLNLVAKEGVLTNERDGVLALSPEAGAWAELGGPALEADPYDISATADTLHRALTMDAAERAERAKELRARVLARTPADWLADQLAAAG